MAGGKNKARKASTAEEQLEIVISKLEHLEGQMSDLKTDNKSLSEQLETIKSDNERIEKQLSDIKADNKSVMLRVKDLERNSKEKDVIIGEMQSKISLLEEKVDEHEQYSLFHNCVCY